MRSSAAHCRSIEEQKQKQPGCLTKTSESFSEFFRRSVLKHFKRMPVYEPPKGSDGEQQYRRLVTLACADLHRRGFTDGVADAFLEKRCGVSFAILLEVPLFLEKPSAPLDLELWVQSLKYAKTFGTTVSGM
jgi:hypothetical protein